MRPLSKTQSVPVVGPLVQGLEQGPVVQRSGHLPELDDLPKLDDLPMLGWVNQLSPPKNILYTFENITTPMSVNIMNDLVI